MEDLKHSQQGNMCLKKEVIPRQSMNDKVNHVAEDGKR